MDLQMVLAKAGQMVEGEDRAEDYSKDLFGKALRTCRQVPAVELV
jgi:hypothetical protein